MIDSVSITCLLTFISFLIFVYRMGLKPKNFPPGPFSAPFIGGMYALGTEPHKNLMKMKKTYGNLIGIDFASTRMVVLNDFDTIKRVFSLPAFQGRAILEVVDEGRGNPSGILWTEGKLVEEQRNFLIRSLRSLGVTGRIGELIIQEQLEQLFCFLDKQSGPIVNQDLFNITAIGALWKGITGEKIKQDDHELKIIMKLTRRAVNALNPIASFFPTLSKLFPNMSGWNEFRESCNLLYEFIDEKTGTYKTIENSHNETQDFISSYLQKIKNTTDRDSSFFGEFGEKSLRDIILDLLAAGTETVATALTWFLSIIIRHPKIQEKLQAEISRVIGTERLPSLSDRERLPYVESFILEILRFSALVATGLPHRTLTDVNLDEFYIPKGTVVLANLYAALHDPEHWDEPEVFKPERFLNEDESEIIRSRSRNVDLVFSYGKRLCPGETLAKDELFIFITGLCQRYTFKKDPNCVYKSEIDVDVAVTLVPKPHTLIISKR